MSTPAKKPPMPEQGAYDAWYDEQIRLGLEDIEAGRVYPHDEVVRRMDAHMKKLEKKHRVKVA